MKRRSLTLFLTLLLLYRSPHPLHAEPPRAENTLAEQAFISDEENEEMEEALKVGEVFFTAHVDRVYGMGIGEPSIPMIRVAFSDIEVLKGKMPKSATFRYPRTPDKIRFAEGMKVFVVLRRSAENPEENDIIAIMDALRLRMSEMKEKINSSIRYGSSETPF